MPECGCFDAQISDVRNTEICSREALFHVLTRYNIMLTLYSSCLILPFINASVITDSYGNCYGDSFAARANIFVCAVLKAKLIFVRNFYAFPVRTATLLHVLESRCIQRFQHRLRLR